MLMRGYNKNYSRIRFILISGACIFLSAMAFNGCAALTEDKNLVEKQIQVDPYLEELERGHQLYRVGNLPGAAQIFENVSQRTESGTILKRALFGLAVTRMVLAEDPKMYEDALRIWSNWSVLAPMTLSVKELRMLEPLFTRILPSELAEMKQREEAYQQEIRRYKQLLAAEKKEKNSLKKKLISKENDIKSLKYKIESLEMIDQEKNRKKRTTSKR